MVEQLDTGIAVSELADGKQSISVKPDSLTAFLGRARKGPLNEPVEVANYQDFARIFGADWSGSLLPEAIRQFFDHGGSRALVVRVANGAQGGELVLPCDAGELVLVALDPGEDEVLRVAVDYDRIDAADTKRFNLTVQRLKGEQRMIGDQEIFDQISITPAARRHVAKALGASHLVRVKGPVPTERPRETGAPYGTGDELGYVTVTRPGTDGAELTDYDLVGSAARNTGLFALDGIDGIDFLYAPPPNLKTDHGPVFMTAAERYCAARSIMLVADPPAKHDDAKPDAVAARAGPVRSPYIFTYFPRPGLRHAPAVRVPVGAALAGLLAAQAQSGTVASSFDDAVLAAKFIAPESLGRADAEVLIRSGINVLEADADERLKPIGSVTLARGLYEDVTSLRIARLVLFVRRALERGTRWVIFGPPDESKWRKLEDQVDDFFRKLRKIGLIDIPESRPGWFVHCNAATNSFCKDTGSEIHFLVGFCPDGTRSPVVLSITQTPRGSITTRAAFVTDIDTQELDSSATGIEHWTLETDPQGGV